MGVAGALRRAARDRALPEPRRRPVRPPPPHAVRRRGHLGRVRRAVRDLDGGRSATARRSGPASWSPPPACCRCRTSPTCPAATSSGAFSTTPAGGRPSRSTSRASGSRSIGTSSSGVQVVAAIVDEVASLTVYQRTANWCTPLNNRPDHRRGAGAAAGRLRGAARGAEHVDPRVPPPDERPRRVRRLGRGAAGVLRADVGQPRVHEAHEQLRRPARQPDGQRRVVRVHRRQDPRHRRTIPTPPSG